MITYVKLFLLIIQTTFFYVQKSTERQSIVNYLHCLIIKPNHQTIKPKFIRITLQKQINLEPINPPASVTHIRE